MRRHTRQKKVARRPEGSKHPPAQFKAGGEASRRDQWAPNTEAFRSARVSLGTVLTPMPPDRNAAAARGLRLRDAFSVAAAAGWDGGAGGGAHHVDSGDPLAGHAVESEHAPLLFGAAATSPVHAHRSWSPASCAVTATAPWPRCDVRSKTTRPACAARVVRGLSAPRG